jgi:hypothetical protein
MVNDPKIHQNKNLRQEEIMKELEPIKIHESNKSIYKSVLSK